MDYYIDQIEDDFGELEWHEVYSFIEFLFANVDPFEKTELTERMNQIFSQEGAQYRIIDGRVTMLMSPLEADTITIAQGEGGLAGGHIKKAIELFNKRPEPDYSNSIKESISAVEALAGKLVGNTSLVLSESIKKLGLHTALEQGIVKLYAWTSDEGGIRHSSKETGTPPTEAEARYMLVQCSLLVNYLSEKNLKIKINYD